MLQWVPAIKIMDLDYNLRRRSEGGNPEPSRGVVCFHCGGAGHLVYECFGMKAGKPQTSKGALAYANFCKITGKNYQYNPSSFKKPAWKKEDKNEDAAKDSPQRKPRRLRRLSESEAKDGKPKPKKDSPKSPPKPVSIVVNTDDEDDEEKDDE